MEAFAFVSFEKLLEVCFSFSVNDRSSNLVGSSSIFSVDRDEIMHDISEPSKFSSRTVTFLIKSYCTWIIGCGWRSQILSYLDQILEFSFIFVLFMSFSRSTSEQVPWQWKFKRDNFADAWSCRFDKIFEAKDYVLVSVDKSHERPA